MIVLVWVSVLLAVLYIYYRQIYSKFSRYGVKHFTPVPVVGNMTRMLLRLDHAVEDIVKLYSSFPEERFVGRYEFSKEMVLIRDIELIKKVGVKDFEHFLDHRDLFGFGETFFNRSLIALHGQEWKDMRSTLSPAFTSSKIRHMVPFIVEVGDQMMRSMKKKIDESKSGYIDVECKDLTSRYTNDVIASCAFGLKVDSHNDVDNEFYAMGKLSTTFTFSQILVFLAIMSMPTAISKYIKFDFLSEKSNTFFRRLVLETMEDRETRKIIRPDMIHLLMEAKKGQLTHEDIKSNDKAAGFATVEESTVGQKQVNRVWTENDLIAQAVLFFVAGFETVSTSMSFLLYELALNPEVQERLVQEIKETDAKNGGKFDFNSIQNMPYLDMVVSEVLRLWPPADTLDRICTKDYNLGKPNDKAEKDFIVQKGTAIAIPVYAIHRDPQFFPNPEKFDPERFSDENKHKIQSFAYMPFGVGPRNCIGSRFALCEIKTMIVFVWVAVLLAALYLYNRQIYSTFSRNGIKHFTPLPFVGNMIKTIFRKEHVTGEIMRLYTEFPKERFVGRYEFMKEMIVIRDIELIKKIGVKDFEYFLDHRAVFRSGESFFSRSLIALEGQEWKDMRSTLSPAFTSSKMRLMVPFIVEVGDQMMYSLKKKIKESNAGYIDLECKDLTTRYSNDVIASCAFGLKVDSHNDEENEFYAMGKGLTQLKLRSMLTFFALLLIPTAVSKFLKLDFFSKETSLFFKKLVLETMHDREVRKIIRPDMIHLLMEAKKGKLTHEDIKSNDEAAGFATVEESAVGQKQVNRVWTDYDLIAQAVLFFFAGFETVSSGMSFLLYELALHPDVQERLVQEIKETHVKNGGKFDFNSIQNMPYLDMVVSEVLRLWPPAIALDRACTKDYNLGKPNENSEKDFIVRKGTGISIPVFAIHRDPQLFPNPDKFDPERFSEENKHNIPMFAYMPFGIGPRNCIGSRFALCEIKTMIFFVWVAVLLAVLYIYYKQTYSKFSRYGVKHFTPVPFLGNMINMLFRLNHTIEDLAKLYTDFPNERFVGRYEFTQEMVIIRDLELVKKIGIKDFEHFLDHRAVFRAGDSYFSRTLIALEEQEWKDMRSTLSPAFTSSKIRQMVPFMVEVGDQMISSLKKKFKESKTGYIDVDCKDLTTRYTNDVIASCAFGLKVDSHNDVDNEFYVTGRATTTLNLRNMLKFFLLLIVPSSVAKFLGLDFFGKTATDFFKKLVLETMNTRELRKVIRPDMIHLLMEAKKGKLTHEDVKSNDEAAGFATVEESAVGQKQVNRVWSDNDLVAQAVLFFLAGFETVSSGMSFLLYELAVNPEVQEKLAQEIKEADAKNGGKFDFNSIQNMPYMDMVVSELLRLWPPGLALDRVCTKDYNLGKPNEHVEEDFITMIYIYIWVAVLLAVLYIYYRQIYSTFSRNGINHFTPVPFLGNMTRILLRIDHVVDDLVKLYNEFPNDRFVGRYEFTKEMVVIRDIELIKKIGVKDFEHFLDHRAVFRSGDSFFTRSLIALEGQEWKDMRSTLSPAFTSSKIRLMIPFMVEVGDQMMRSLKKKIKESKTDYIDVDCKDLTTRYGNDVIASCAFGLKVDSHNDEDNDFYVMGKASTKLTFRSMIMFFALLLVPSSVAKYLKIDFFPKSAKTFFKNLVLETMNDREVRNIIRPDMIHLLMEAKKGKLTHEETKLNDEAAGFATVAESAVGQKQVNRVWSDNDLIAQAVLFFLAGFETVSTAMSFLMYELAVNPEVQEKLAQEIKDTDAKNGGKFDFNSIQNMTYMDMVVSEVLRLWPPGLALDRVCTKDYNLGKPNDKAEDYIVPKGTAIAIPVYAIHRDPQYFPNPEKFDPERFSDENKHNIPVFAYMPFGIGPRNCIGSRFALCEVKVMVYQILQHMVISPCEKTKIPAKLDKKTFNVLLEGGHWLRFKPRT
ncbi:hypothetical protein PYW07_016837 [Mythimna separata]|uniref:unspecific monooxygenase n=1 Tax=Mythimna separata TaxID=271217 RepID=A0AAD8DXZ4_MYTSE|nr:hypothetical protein PYW07_016837 [Mythimna separata]